MQVPMVPDVGIIPPSTLEFNGNANSRAFFAPISQGAGLKVSEAYGHPRRPNFGP